MIVPVAKLAQLQRGDEFVAAARAAGQVDGFELLHIEEAVFDELLGRFPMQSPRLSGLGDLVAAVAKPIAKAVGLEDCGSCAERQAWLNEKVPFGH